MKTSWELAALLAAAFVLHRCVPTDPGPASSGAQRADESDDEDEELTEEEKKYLAAARPFAEAIAARNYEAAHRLLSSHAQARMSLNQLNPPEEDAEFERNEKAPLQGVTAAQFAELMKRIEDRHGTPKSIESLDVFETDPAVLSRQSKEKLGNLDSMFAIGAMPDSIPFDIRRASIRGAIRTQLNDAAMAKAAAELGTTVEELKRDEDFGPYFNIKIVLVEEEGALRVGYFEFLPPSLFD